MQSKRSAKRPRAKAGATRLPREAILIVNTHSRRGREEFDRCVELLTRHGVKLIEARRIDDPQRIKREVKAAVSRAPMVIVGGGDGTLSSTIDYFKDKETVFALLPLGTANSFARALGLPLKLEGAVEVIATGIRRRIDLGCINGDYFGNSAAIGLSPLIARSVPPRLKRYLGRAGYLMWAAKVGAQFRPFRLTFNDGKTSATAWATEVRIANGGFFGGVELVEHAQLDDGEMVVQVVTGKSNRNLVSSWISNMLRLSNRDQWQAEIRARELRIETYPPMDVTIDGELAARTPITVSVAPRAVDIAAPRES